MKIKIAHENIASSTAEVWVKHCVPMSGEERRGEQKECSVSSLKIQFREQKQEQTKSKLIQGELQQGQSNKWTGTLLKKKETKKFLFKT